MCLRIFIVKCWVKRKAESSVGCLSNLSEVTQPRIVTASLWTLTFLIVELRSLISMYTPSLAIDPFTFISPFTHTKLIYFHFTDGRAEVSWRAPGLAWYICLGGRSTGVGPTAGSSLQVEGRKRACAVTSDGLLFKNWLQINWFYEE